MVMDNKENIMFSNKSIMRKSEMKQNVSHMSFIHILWFAYVSLKKIYHFSCYGYLGF